MRMRCGTRRVVLASVLMVFAAMLLFVHVDHAKAAGSTTQLDQELSQKQGVDGSLAPVKGLDPNKKPSGFKMFLGLASIPVMIAVVKWL